LLPPIADPTLLRGLYDGLDALLLSGGKDVHPIHYDEPLHQKSNPAFPERDEMELTLSRWVVDDGKPLLAICRGIQVLNVALGGSLYQDIGDQVPGASRHAWHDGHPRDHLPHRVAINAGSRLASIVGATSLPVNSLHHQAIKSVASGLIVVAQAPDGIIEAAEVEGHPFALSVQWHPEELTGGDARARKLFEALVHACPP
jgi:putative glutamine amidotransferase